jgi:hypothetical protein
MGVDIPRVTTAVIVMTAAGLVLAGCGDEEKTEVGAVMRLNSLCVGRAAATGTGGVLSPSGRVPSVMPSRSESPP